MRIFCTNEQNFTYKKNPSAIMFCMHNVIETENIKDTTDEI